MIKKSEVHASFTESSLATYANTSHASSMVLLFKMTSFLNSVIYEIKLIHGKCLLLLSQKYQDAEIKLTERRTLTTARNNNIIAGPREANFLLHQVSRAYNEGRSLFITHKKCLSCSRRQSAVWTWPFKILRGGFHSTQDLNLRRQHMRLAHIN